MKLLQKKEAVLERMGERLGWVDDFTQRQLYAIGLLEILGALGLILPALTGTFTVLVPLAAVGLVVLMLGATLTHRRRAERDMMIFTLVLALLGFIVAYGRFAVVPL
jgi:hypothetical protein